MSRKHIITLAALSTLCAAPALALDTGETYQVYFDGDLVGRWTLRNLVSDTGSACRYTVRWQNLSRSRTVSCSIDELKAGSDFDCEEARRGFFNTVVQKTRGVTCNGFDFFGRQSSISTLIGGETEDGDVNGVARVASVGDVLNLQVSP